MDRYDADTAPDPAAWLALDDGQRLALVRAHHRGRVLRIHPKDFDPRIHAVLHATVETQIATGDPPATRRAVERLVGDGLRRHAAVHAAAEVLLGFLAKGEAYDAAAYEAAMDRVQAGDWLGDRMRKDLGGG